MNSLIRFAVGLAAIAAALSVAAEDLKVDMVVNLTEAGKKIVRPDAAHPAYYYPISKGYTEGGQIIDGMAKPPADWDVLHTIAKALYDQGYRMTTKAHQPDLLLIFWWGYKAAAIINDDGSAGAGSGMIGGKGGGNAAAIAALSESGEMPTNTTANGTEMEELVMGSNYEADYSGSTTMQNEPNLRLQNLINATRVPRFYVMISALDFNQALKKKFVVYWTARVSTAIYDHTLAEVIPTLVADVAPSLGRDTGPEITDRPVVPEGTVIVGTPTVVAAHPASASHPPKSP